MATRIFLLAALAVGGLLLSLGVEMSGGFVIHAAEREARAYTRMYAQGRDVQAKVAEAAHHAEAFLRVKQADLGEHARETLADALRDARLLGNAPLLAPRRPELERLGEELEQSLSVLVALIEHTERLGLTEEQGLEGQLRAAAHGIENALASVALDGVRVALLSVRRHEKDYLLRHRPEYLDKVAAAQIDLRQSLLDSGLPADQIRALNAEAERYLETVRLYGAGDQAQRALVRQFDEAQKALEAPLAALTQALERERDQRQDHADRISVLARNGSLGVGVAVLVVFGVLARRIARGLTGPLADLTHVMQRMAEGERALEVGHQDRRDEMGTMARALDGFRQQLADSEEKERQAAQARQRDLDRARRLAALTEAFDRAVSRALAEVGEVVGHVDHAAKALAQAAEVSIPQGQAVAQAAEEATANLQTVRAASEELSGATTEISQRAQDGSVASRAAVARADEAATRVRALQQSGEAIGAVVAMIEEIAGRTNLLALNATIEAARAGEAGKGFAVVAGEVKALSQQTARATADIQGQIGAVQGETRAAAAAIVAVREDVVGIDGVVTSIAAAVEEQVAATREIARSMGEATQATTAVSRAMVDVSRAVEDSGGLAQEMQDVAEKLAREMAALRREVDAFLGDVRKG